MATVSYTEFTQTYKEAIDRNSDTIKSYNDTPLPQLNKKVQDEFIKCDSNSKDNSDMRSCYVINTIAYMTALDTYINSRLAQLSYDEGETDERKLPTPDEYTEIDILKTYNKFRDNSYTYCKVFDIGSGGEMSVSRCLVKLNSVYVDQLVGYKRFVDTH